MIRLELSDAEAQVLAKALEYYLSELSMEISNTEKFEMREELKNEQAALKKIVASLGA